MSLELARIDVVLPVDLSASAGGAEIVTCRYIGNVQLRKIDLAGYAQKSENRAVIGEEWVARMTGLEQSDPERLKDHEVKLEQQKVDDPVAWALEQWPADFVCKYAIRAIDGTRASFDDIKEWIDDGLNPAVVKHIAVTVLRASGLIPESEQERGEGSGVSSEV